jgi:hypothetical protein
MYSSGTGIFVSSGLYYKGMDRILIWPDIRLIQKPDTGYPAGYPALSSAGYPLVAGYQMGYPVVAGYRISGRFLCSKF